MQRREIKIGEKWKEKGEKGRAHGHTNPVQEESERRTEEKIKSRAGLPAAKIQQLVRKLALHHANPLRVALFVVILRARARGAREGKRASEGRVRGRPHIAMRTTLLQDREEQEFQANIYAKARVRGLS